MPAGSILRIDRGDAKTWACRILDETRVPLNLTGWSIAVGEVAPELTGFVSVAWTDASAGEFNLILASVPTLTIHVHHGIRIKYSPPADSLARARFVPLLRVFAS